MSYHQPPPEAQIEEARRKFFDTHIKATTFLDGASRKKAFLSMLYDNIMSGRLRLYTPKLMNIGIRFPLKRGPYFGFGETFFDEEKLKRYGSKNLYEFFEATDTYFLKEDTHKLKGLFDASDERECNDPTKAREGRETKKVKEYSAYIRASMLYVLELAQSTRTWETKKETDRHIVEEYNKLLSLDKELSKIEKLPRSAIDAVKAALRDAKERGLLFHDKVQTEPGNPKGASTLDGAEEEGKE